MYLYKQKQKPASDTRKPDIIYFHPHSKTFFQKLQNLPIYPSSALKRQYKFLRIRLISLTQNMKDTPIIRVHVDGKYDPNKDYSQDYTRRSKIRLQVIPIMQKF